MTNFDKLHTVPSSEDLARGFLELIQLVFTRDSGKTNFDPIFEEFSKWIVKKGGKLDQDRINDGHETTKMIRKIPPIEEENRKKIEIKNFILSLLPIELNGKQNTFLEKVINMAYMYYYMNSNFSYKNSLDLIDEFNTLFN